LQTEVDCADESLGRLGNSKVLRHRDCGLLKRSKLLKARSWIDSSGDG
jgi:hypothetical protein